MDTKYNFGPVVDDRLVYVRAVDVAELPEDVRDQAGGADQIYAVHTADGERLALVRDRKMAFVLARQNEYAPVTVH